MIMSLLEFKLKPGKETALKEVFLKHQILETAIQVKGCLKLAMSAPQTPDDTVKIIGFWEDNVSYQGWLDHPERGTAQADFIDLVAGPWESAAPAQLYDVKHAVPEPHAW